MVLPRFPWLTIVAGALIIVVAASLTSSVRGEQTKQREIPSSVQVQLDAYIARYIDQYEAENCEPEPETPAGGLNTGKQEDSALVT